MTVEQALADHAARGEPLDLDGAAVPASVLRDIVLGRLGQELDPHGLRLRNARIEGRLDLEHVESVVPLELTDCTLADGLVARDARLAAFVLVDCRLTSSAEPAADLQRLETSLLNLHGSVVTSASEHGALSLVDARIRVLQLSDATLQDTAGPALVANSLQVDHDMLMKDVTATGAGPAGAVQLAGARIGGLLSLTGAQLRNDSGPALTADNVRVERGLLPRDGFTATGTGEDGAVRLLGADVGAALDFTGASLRNDTGPALICDSIHVRLDMFLRNGFLATATSELGAVRLLGARIDGQLDLSDADLRNDAGAALEAKMLRVEHELFLNADFTAAGGGPHATVDLTGATIGGPLSFAPTRLTHAKDPRGRVRLDGLTYAGLPQDVSTADWLRLVAKATPAYAAQPYQQLAAALRAAGHDGEARRVLIAQRRDQIRRRALTGRGERTWARFTGLTLGYGYQPWRALLGLLATVVVGVVLALVLGNPECTTVAKIGLGLDLGTPLLDTQVQCATTDTSAGQALTVAGWGLSLLAWAFATLFVAGFTGAVRKT